MFNLPVHMTNLQSLINKYHWYHIYIHYRKSYNYGYSNLLLHLTILHLSKESTNSNNMIATTILKFIHHNVLPAINLLLQVMVLQPNNIRYQPAMFIFDKITFIQLLNYIYNYVNQDIYFVHNENYVIHLIYGYDFIIHYY